jgi:hypothetical protein
MTTSLKEALQRALAQAKKRPPAPKPLPSPCYKCGHTVRRSGRDAGVRLPDGNHAHHRCLHQGDA